MRYWYYSVLEIVETWWCTCICFGNKTMALPSNGTTCCSLHRIASNYATYQWHALSHNVRMMLHDHRLRHIAFLNRPPQSTSNNSKISNNCISPKSFSQNDSRCCHAIHDRALPPITTLYCIVSRHEELENLYYPHHEQQHTRELEKMKIPVYN